MVAKLVNAKPVQTATTAASQRRGKRRQPTAAMGPRLASEEGGGVLMECSLEFVGTVFTTLILRLRHGCHQRF